MGKVSMESTVENAEIRTLVDQADCMENYEFEGAVELAAKRLGLSYGALRNKVVDMYEELNG